MLAHNLRIQIQGKHHLQITVTALAAFAFSQCVFDPVNSQSTKSEASTNGNTNTNKEELFENQCLKRQMYTPKVPYPAWDYNWDGNETPETSLEAAKQGLTQTLKGKTRHVILVRHGQYEESSDKDEERVLTPLGRLQAIRTGKRLRDIMNGNGSETFPSSRFRGPCPIAAVRVSSMTRARETAELIAAELGLQVQEPDPDLNEAIPAPIVPIRHDIARTTEEIDQNHQRIERAFQRYFYRSNPCNITPDNEDKTVDEPQEEFEIIICHGNVIRYFFCRAL